MFLSFSNHAKTVLLQVWRRLEKICLYCMNSNFGCHYCVFENHLWYLLLGYNKYDNNLFDCWIFFSSMLTQRTQVNGVIPFAGFNEIRVVVFSCLSGTNLCCTQQTYRQTNPAVDGYWKSHNWKTGRLGENNINCFSFLYVRTLTPSW